jgi:hypothetical protein
MVTFFRAMRANFSFFSFFGGGNGGGLGARHGGVLCSFLESRLLYASSRFAGGAASAISPQFLHLRSSSSALNAFTASLICVPRSEQWKAASWTTALQAPQYQRSRSRLPAGRGCSITMPTVSAKRTGLCGMFAIRAG